MAEFHLLFDARNGFTDRTITAPPGGTACLALAGITQGVYELDRHSWIAGGICLGLGVLFGLSAMGNVQRQQDAAGTDGKPE